MIMISQEKRITPAGQTNAKTINKQQIECQRVANTKIGLKLVAKKYLLRTLDAAIYTNEALNC